MRLAVLVPPNTTATIYVPKTAADSSVEATRGAEFVSEDGDYAVFNVPSGSFVFEEAKR